MRTYEALYIVSPELEDDAIQTIDNDVQAIVTNNGGTIVRSEIWGKRKLAYTVKNFTEGNYILFRYEAEQEVLPKLEAYFKLSEAVIRSLTLHLDAHTLRLEAEQQEKKEAELANAPEGGDRDDDRRPRRYDDDDDDRPRRPRRPAPPRAQEAPAAKPKAEEAPAKPAAEEAPAEPVAEKATVEPAAVAAEVAAEAAPESKPEEEA